MNHLEMVQFAQQELNETIPELGNMKLRRLHATTRNGQITKQWNLEWNGIHFGMNELTLKISERALFLTSSRARAI